MSKYIFTIIISILLLTGCTQSDPSGGISDVEESHKILEESRKTVETTVVTFYLLGNFGMVDMSGDISRYLEPVEVEVDGDVSDDEGKIIYALAAMFDIEDMEYGESGLSNLLYASDLSVGSVTNENGVIEVDIAGDLVGIGSVADAFVPLQITETIEHYTDDYLITLNGSEADWRCALDASGLCE